MILCPQMSHLASNSVGGAMSAAAAKNGQSSSAGPSTFHTGGVNQRPALNILNQANNISQLSATNTSFDPSQLVVSSEVQQADGVITAFSGLVVQNSSGDSGSAAGVISATSSMKGPATLRVSPTLQQQQQHHVALQVQPQLVQSNQTIVHQSSSPPTTVSPPPIAVMAQHQQQVTHQHHRQAQMTYHHVQPLQPKPMQNGRVPATKHDNRKLFVGGLPNEGKLYHK